MVRLQCVYLLPLLSALAAVANPLDDAQVREFLKKRNSSLKPLTLTRRDAAGIRTRHLRPPMKRDAIIPPDIGQVADFNGSTPEPVRNGAGYDFGSSDTNSVLDAQNPDDIAPPPTDSGTVPNLKWSFSLSHTRVLKGGWVREQTITDLPPSQDIAAAELRLAPNAYRELHWHKISEWGYILNGTGRLSAVDKDGKTYISDLKGPTNGSDPDIYYIPKDVPHSIQALEEGLEILLIFTDGNFDATGTTFMLSDWLARTPLDVVAKNFGLNVSQLSGIPQKDPYILPATVPPPPFGDASAQEITGPAGTVPQPYVFHLSEQEKQIAPGGGGWVKIQDSVTNFPVSVDLASALVFVEPNGMRELHWHSNDEWLYILSGNGRATAFAGSSTSRTFDFQTGDTGVFPDSYGHYMQNLSPTAPLVFLELFKAPQYTEFTATQWLALTPPQVVADLLNISVATVEMFKKEKQIIVA